MPRLTKLHARQAQQGAGKISLVFRCERERPDPTEHDDVVKPDPHANSEFSKLLTKDQMVAATALASGANATDAARIAQVSVTKVRSWRKKNVAFAALVQHICNSFLLEARNEASRIMLSKLRRFRKGKAEMGESALEWTRLALYMTSSKMNPGAGIRPTPEQLHNHLHVHGSLPGPDGAIPGNTAGDPSTLVNLGAASRKLSGDDKRLLAALLRGKGTGVNEDMKVIPAIPQEIPAEVVEA